MTLYQPNLFLAGPQGAGERLALWNGFAALAGQPLPLARGSMTFELAAPPPPGTLTARLEMEAPRAELHLVLERFPFAELAPVELEAADLPGLQPDLAEALLSGVLVVLGDLVPPERRPDVSLGGLCRLGPAPSGTEWLRVRVEGASREPIVLLLGIGREALLDLLAHHTLPVPRRQGPLAERIQLAADITLGSLVLTLAELRAIEPGDVVVMADRQPDDIAIRVGETEFLFSPAEGGYASSGPRMPGRLRPAAFRPEPTHMDDEAQSGASETADLGGVTVSVDFDIGRVAIPFATVAAWTAGTVIGLQAPATDAGVPVTIRVNGEAVGTGDIVRIDERIGVRITRLLPNG